MPENIKKWIIDEEKADIFNYNLRVDYSSYSQGNE